MHTYLHYNLLQFIYEEYKNEDKQVSLSLLPLLYFPSRPLSSFSLIKTVQALRTENFILFSPSNFLPFSILPFPLFLSFSSSSSSSYPLPPPVPSFPFHLIICTYHENICIYTESKKKRYKVIYCIIL